MNAPVPPSPVAQREPLDFGDLRTSYTKAVANLRARQNDNGALAGEVVWNPMLVCQWVIVCHCIGAEIPEERRRRVYRYLERCVAEDGGYGMHPSSHSYLFHTVLAYVTLRLLGYDDTDPLSARAKSFIHGNGGPYVLPTWGRIWLAILGLHPWNGIQPIVPELWLLPRRSPAHPSRLYCHMRLIYLGLSFAYGKRITAGPSDVVESIRASLYPDGYDLARFDRHRDEIAATDVFEAPSRGLRLAFAALRRGSALTPNAVRERALAAAMEHIHFELRSTEYVCLSPVNGLLFCLALHATGQEAELEKAIAGVEYWVWEDDEEGLRICGARSDIWDTSFSLQALCEGPEVEDTRALIHDATLWLPTAQLQEDIVGAQEHHRAPAYGGWGFANERHPWPVSDCTAEALEALHHCEVAELSPSAGRLQVGRKIAAVEFILLRQNDDGGFGSYEARRGSMALKNFNPAEIYGNCMLEYSYTECTASCVKALALAQRDLNATMTPELRARVSRAVEQGTRFIIDAQDKAGGWLGFWGINLTYGTIFAVDALLAAGFDRQHPAIVRACRRLLETQRGDGGWGEDAQGMLEDRYIELPQGTPSTAAQSAWALLALLAACPHERSAIDRGLAFLIGRQQDDGAWPREPPTGCFFNTAALEYTHYQDTFPTWALARALRARAGDPADIAEADTNR